MKGSRAWREARGTARDHAGSRARTRDSEQVPSRASHRRRCRREGRRASGGRECGSRV